MPTATHHRAGEALPRPLITIGVPCAGVLLIAFFLIRGFPYDKLGELIADRIERSHGIHLAVGDIGPALQLAGIALESTQLRVTFPDRSPQQIDRALIRPAWSLSWLTGEPTFHVELETPSGSADGTLHWNGAASWAGTIRNARPDLPPIADWIPIGGFEGTLEAMIDISMGDSGPEGLVEFEIRDGSIFLPGLSAPLPFEKLTGAASFGGDVYAKLTSLSFEGPLASGSGSGTIGLAESLEQAPIGFEFQIVAKDEARRAMQAGGLKLKSGGEGLAKISGTVAKPKIR
ncbi:MAG: type II secretion system protein GspN [Myxococcales bacterium]|nr:type II secretion system protein GspN [Myxococcales bacterium]